MSCSGSIELIIGPMFSGKSTELLRRIKRARVAACRVMLFKPSCDTRPDTPDLVETHDKTGETAICISSGRDIEQYMDAAAAGATIGIDEGQFIPDLKLAVLALASAGHRVIIAGLSGTFERAPFDGPNFTDMSQLLCLASSVQMLTAICTICYAEASFSAMRVSTCQSDPSRVQLGGAERYMALCHACYDSQLAAASV